MKYSIALLALFAATVFADINLRIPTSDLQTPKIPSLSSALKAIPGLLAAKAVAEGVGKAVTGAASNAAALGNKITDASHDRLKEFGGRQSENMGIVTDGIREGWMDFHRGFDDQFEQVGDGMKRFGSIMHGLTGRLPGPLGPNMQATWDGFQKPIDKSMDRTLNQLQRIGNAVGGNINDTGKGVQKMWNEGVRPAVDGTIDNSRKATNDAVAAGTSPLKGQGARITIQGGPKLNSDNNGRESSGQQPRGSQNNGGSDDSRSGGPGGDHRRGQGPQGQGPQGQGPQGRGPQWNQQGPQWNQRGPQWNQQGPRWNQQVPQWNQQGPQWNQQGPQWIQQGPQWNQQVPQWVQGNVGNRWVSGGWLSPENREQWEQQGQRLQGQEETSIDIDVAGK